jgi:hypothetical protein
VLVSGDAAGSFAAGTGLPEGLPTALAISSFFLVDPVMFTAVGNAGVFKSRDAGQTWSPSGLAGRTVTDLVWLGPLLFAATDEGLMRSDNAGLDWKPWGGLAAGPARRVFFPLFPDSGLEIFVVNREGIQHTPNGGKAWKAAGTPEDEVLCLATFPPMKVDLPSPRH